MQPIGWVSRLFHAKTAMKKEKLRLVIVAMAPRFPLVADEVALIEWIVETKFVDPMHDFRIFCLDLLALSGFLPSLLSGRPPRRFAYLYLTSRKMDRFSSKSAEKKTRGEQDRGSNNHERKWV